MYIARPIEDIEYMPGAWHGQRVGVYRCQGDVETQVGEYERNYPTLFNTFVPFHAGGRHLALYAPDYTCTRLLELPSCRDIGGEEPSATGFCPVDFFVPYYVDVEVRIAGKPSRRFRKQMPVPADMAPRTITVSWPTTPTSNARNVNEHHTPLGTLTYHPFGFVAGCLWGDDSSWKIQYLDLTRAAEGILRRDERFGYLELPDGVPLDRAIDLSDFQADAGGDVIHHVSITVVRRFDLRDGRPISPVDESAT